MYVSEDRIFFNREIQIKVHVSRNTKKGKEVWNGTISSCGTSNDLRIVVDYLLKSAFEHFGYSTQRQVTEVYNTWGKEYNENY